ncbi:acyltransferase [Georgenia yuyongxinii]|uniref:Acyltransferase n=2 Tax=Georgenia yuyongxinii TaxID=2589797 RepID=A0A5B8C4P3_9MICO|nr:acyltransferase [Georgenia yuyongxinii]
MATTLRLRTSTPDLGKHPRMTAYDRPRLYAIDGIRFLAAVGVMLYHFTARWSQVWGDDPGHVFPETGPVLIYAVLGPELFFVVSGFAILMTAWGRDVPYVVASRLARLYPPYWIAVVATSVLLLFIWPAGKDISVHEALVNLTMLQELFDVRHVDGVYWTLWVELRFYLIMVLLVEWGITRKRLLWLCALWPVVAQVALELGWEHASTALADGYAPFFAGGMLLYLMHREGHAVVPWLLVVMNVGLAVRNTVPWQMTSVTTNTVFTPNPWVLGVLTAGCFAAIAVIALTRVQHLRAPWLMTFGALTYPLYLIHEYWGWWAIDLLAPHANRWVVLAAACALAVVLAIGLHALEKRLSPRMRRSVETSLRRARPALSPRTNRSTVHS